MHVITKFAIHDMIYHSPFSTFLVLFLPTALLWTQKFHSIFTSTFFFFISMHTVLYSCIHTYVYSGKKAMTFLFKFLKCKTYKVNFYFRRVPVSACINACSISRKHGVRAEILNTTQHNTTSKQILTHMLLVYGSVVFSMKWNLSNSKLNGSGSNVSNKVL